MTHFDHDTRLSRLDDQRFAGFIHSDWNIGDKPNGGYLASVAMAALGEAVPAHPDPLSLTVHYLRPGSADTACEVSTRVIRSGRTITTAAATLVQDARPRVELLATLGRLGQTPQTRLAIPAPPIAAPEQCMLRPVNQLGTIVHMADRLEIRLHQTPAHATDPAYASPATISPAVISGWIRFRDDRPPDTRALLLFADAFPPSIFASLGMVGWVPTIEITIQVRRAPVPGWIQAEFRTSDLADGRLVEDGLLWDQAGHLVAQSRQLALLPSAG